MSVAVSGNTIRRTAVAHRMAIEIRQTGSVGVRVEIHWRTGKELRKEILAGRVET